MEIRYFKHKGFTPHGLTYVVMEHARKRLRSLKFAYYNLQSSAVNVFINELVNKYPSRIIIKILTVVYIYLFAVANLLSVNF